MMTHNNSMRLLYIFYTAAVAIAIAGVLHLIVGAEPEHIERSAVAIFFFISGIGQIFWALPTAKRWTRPWHYVGVAGNAVLIILWGLTRMPNPITGGEAEPIDETGITVQLLQVSYIALIATAIMRQRQMMRIDHEGGAEAV